MTGGFSRTAFNAGAVTPLASVVTAGFIAVVLLLFTNWFTELPQAVLAAIVIAAVVGLVDVADMQHISKVKRSDGVSLGIAFVATLALGVELGLAVAVSGGLVMLIVRVMNPHSAELGRLPGTETYRNLERFVLDGAGINDLDASAEAALSELVDEFDEIGVDIHLANMKGPVRDVLIRSGLWARPHERVHPSVHLAVTSISGASDPRHRFIGLDERHR